MEELFEKGSIRDSDSLESYVALVFIQNKKRDFACCNIPRKLS